jgi:hypothetical protein
VEVFKISINDDEKAKFEERLAKEIEEAKYAKWKSEQLNHSIAPSKKVSNDVLRRGVWVCCAGGFSTFVFSGFVVVEVIGLIVGFVGLIMVFSGMATERKRRNEMGI